MKKLPALLLGIIVLFPIFSMPHQAIAASTLLNNIVSYYKLDEASGNASDSVGTNTLTNTSVTFGAAYGKINNGGSFNGSTSLLNNTSPTGIPTGATAWTVNGWVYLTSRAGTASDNMLASWGTGAIRQMVGLSADSANNASPPNTVALYTYGDDLNSNTTLTLNAWHMITGVYDGNVTLTLYADGVSIGTHTLAAPLNVTMSAGGLEVGHGVWDYTHNKYIHGNIDEVGIWSRALTSTEVQQLYNSGAGLQYTFTVAAAAVTRPFNWIWF